MNVVVQIDGREAVPVRAIPLLTYGEMADARTIAQAFAGIEDEWAPGFLGLTAYRAGSGEPSALKPLWWENNALFELNVLHAHLAELQEANTINQDTAIQRWRSESWRLLPAGVFVWKDGLVACFQQEVERDRWTIARNAKMLTREQAEERAQPDFDPLLPAELGALVMAGFEVIAEAPRQPAPAETFADRVAVAVGFARSRLGEAVWNEWASHPVVPFKHAVRLLAFIDPDDARGRTAPQSLQNRLRNIVDRDPRPRGLMDWMEDHERSLMEWGKGAPHLPAVADSDTSQRSPKRAETLGKDIAEAPGQQVWSIKSVDRGDELRRALLRVLVEADKSKAHPTAHDVLEAWRVNPPIGIARVNPDGVDFSTDGPERERSASIRQLNERIKGLVQYPASRGK